MKKKFTLSDIRNYKPVQLEFDGAWRDAIGDPEIKGSWLIWGNSSNGKTSFSLQLAMYLTKFCKVIYNSIEEGMSLSMQNAVKRLSVERGSKYRFSLLDKVDMEELKTMLRKKRSANVVFIDSIQYTGMNYAEYKRMRDEFPNKLFVFISHSDGKEPKGNVARSVKYDAFVKIRVSHFVAYCQSRYGGGKSYVIWPSEAAKYTTGKEE